MIKLTGGAVQSTGGIIVPLGSMELTLSTDASVIATPGQVVSAIPVYFPFDSSGNLLGSCQIYSNAELNPAGTYYTVNLYTQNKARINQNPLVWVFSQSSGSSVDIGTIIPSSPSSPSYPGAVLLNPTVVPQILQTGDLNPATDNSQSLGSSSKRWLGQFASILGLSGQFTPNAAGGLDIGTSALPFSGVRIGAAATNNIRLTGTATAGRTATLPDNTGIIAELNLAQSFTASQTIGQTTIDGTTGNVSTYRNVATADFGHPTIYGTPVHLTGQTANLAATSIYPAPVTGMYLINVQCRTTTAGSGTTATFTLTWADEGGAKSFSSGTFALNSVAIAGVVTTTIPIHVNSGTAVQIAVSGTIGTSVYAVDAWLERIT